MAAVTAAMVKELRDLTGAGMMDCKKALSESDGNIDKAIDYLRENGLAMTAKKAGRIAAEGLARFAISPSGGEAVVVEINSETDFVAKNEEFVEFVDKVAEIALGQGADVNEEALKGAAYSDGETIAEKLMALIAKIGENMNLRRVKKFATPGVKYVGYLHGGGRIAVLVGLKTEADAGEVEECGKDVAMQIASMRPLYVDESAIDPEYLEHEREILTAQTLNEGRPANIVDKIVEGRLNKQLKEVCLVEQSFVKNGDITVKQYVDECAKNIGKPVQVVEMVRYEVGEGLEKRNEDFAAEVAKQMCK